MFSWFQPGLNPDWWQQHHQGDGYGPMGEGHLSAKGEDLPVAQDAGDQQQT